MTNNVEEQPLYKTLTARTAAGIDRSVSTWLEKGYVLHGPQNIAVDQSATQGSMRSMYTQVVVPSTTLALKRMYRQIEKEIK